MPVLAIGQGDLLEPGIALGLYLRLDKTSHFYEVGGGFLVPTGSTDRPGIGGLYAELGVGRFLGGGNSAAYVVGGVSPRIWGAYDDAIMGFAPYAGLGAALGRDSSVRPLHRCARGAEPRPVRDPDRLRRRSPRRRRRRQRREGVPDRDRAPRRPPVLTRRPALPRRLRRRGLAGRRRGRRPAGAASGGRRGRRRRARSRDAGSTGCPCRRRLRRRRGSRRRCSAWRGRRGRRRAARGRSARTRSGRGRTRSPGAPGDRARPGGGAPGCRTWSVTLMRFFLASTSVTGTRSTLGLPFVWCIWRTRSRPSDSLRRLNTWPLRTPKAAAYSRLGAARAPSKASSPRRNWSPSLIGMTSVIWPPSCDSDSPTGPTKTLT